jgi:hypothetical protein
MDMACGAGPRQVLRRLQRDWDVQGSRLWLEEARIDAILGACRLSMSSVKSGVRCYLAFAEAVAPGKLPFPPELGTLLSWSALFRSEGTFANYLAHVRTATLLCRADTRVRNPFVIWGGHVVCACNPQVFDDVALSRAKESVRKRHNFVRRPRMWIRRWHTSVFCSRVWAVCWHEVPGREVVADVCGEG